MGQLDVQLYGVYPINSNIEGRHQFLQPFVLSELAVSAISANMTSVAPLSMSQTKDDLLKHLNMPLETYNLMAKETDRVYKWLTKDPAHLKKNCKRKPPYDWSDIVEKAKDHAMQIISENGDEYTAYYWSLASPTSDCPNWIAKWFLYHKFRYRDGRNRNAVKDRDEAARHAPNQHGQHHLGSTDYAYSTANHGAYQEGSMNADDNSQSNSRWEYNVAPSDSNSAQLAEPKTYYDPIRDV